MANQGCPGEGSDTRLFGWLCPIQRMCSWHSGTEPFSIFLAFPPFLAVNIPLPRGRYLSIRVGCRYDRSWRGYIAPEAIVKCKDQPLWY